MVLTRVSSYEASPGRWLREGAPAPWTHDLRPGSIPGLHESWCSNLPIHAEAHTRMKPNKTTTQRISGNLTQMRNSKRKHIKMAHPSLTAMPVWTPGCTEGIMVSITSKNSTPPPFLFFSLTHISLFSPGWYKIQRFTCSCLQL